MIDDEAHATLVVVLAGGGVELAVALVVV